MKPDPNSFAAFIAAYNTGAILSDATWRAYDIEHMVTSRRLREAMRKVSGENTYNGFAAVAAAYGLGTADRAKHLLGLWWTWARIALGIGKRSLKLREINYVD